MIEVINSVTRNDALGNSDRLGGFIQWSLIKRAGLLLSVNSSRFHKANEVPDGVGSMLVKSWWIIQEVRICLCMENWSGKFQIDMNSVVPTTFLIGSKLVRVIYVCNLTLWKQWINLKLGKEEVYWLSAILVKRMLNCLQVECLSGKHPTDGPEAWTEWC